MKISKVYCYGLLSPTLNSDLVSQQIKLAHRYQNKLVEINLAYRSEYDAAMACDALTTIEKKIEEAPEGDRETLKKERSAIKAERRKVPEVVMALEAAKAKKENAIREARHKVSHDPEPIQQGDSLIKPDPLYWGTYLIAEQAAEAAAGGFDKPKFHHFDGSGAVAVQIQKGMSVDRLLGGDDNRARLLATPVPVPDRNGSPLPRIRLRIGSDENKDPIWAEWPLIYHRNLPSNGSVKWLKVIRTKTATRTIWNLHVTLDVDIEEAKEVTGVPESVLALDLRWKGDHFSGNLTLRAGEWTDGNERGAIMLDESVRGALDKADSLQSIRDDNLNEIHPKLIGWAKREGLPEEHKERLSRIATWESQSRFAGLAIWWRDHRIEGDSDVFNMLDSWRKRDKHLWLYEAGTRRRALSRRQHHYRNIAARLAKTHTCLVVERIALDKLAKKPEKDDPGQKKARKQRVDTAPSVLRRAFVDAFRNQGKKIFEVSPGPLLTVWQSWCEHGGVEKKFAARSNRFQRRQKKSPPPSDGPAQAT